VCKKYGGAILELFDTELFDVYDLNYIHVVVDVIVSSCKFLQHSLESFKNKLA
jgi:hypothetical protein